MTNKACQYCGEKILAVAILCKHCKSNLEPKEPHDIVDTSEVSTTDESAQSLDSKAELEETKKEEKPKSRKAKIAEYTMSCIVMLAVYSYLTGSSDEPNLGAAKSSDKELAGIFRHWTKNSGVGKQELNLSKVIAQGTVSSRAFNLDSDSAHRSPAILACFNYAGTTYGIYDSNSEICVLHVEHEKSNYVSQMHRGESKIGALWDKLNESEFRSSSDPAS